MPEDSLAGAVNPAAITAVDSRGDIGAMIFKPSARATLGGFQQQSTLVIQQRAIRTVAEPSNIGADYDLFRTDDPLHRGLVRYLARRGRF